MRTGGCKEAIKPHDTLWARDYSEDSDDEYFITVELVDRLGKGSAFRRQLGKEYPEEFQRH
jgi:hypothetical protein